MKTVGNLITKLAYFIIVILPFIFLWIYQINLFQNNAFVAIYILTLILLSLNSLTDFDFEIPGLKVKGNNTGASIEVLVNLKDSSFKVQLHGGTDDEKIKKLTTEIGKQLKEKKVL